MADRVSTGVAGLDRILHGGFVPGSAVLVEGTPGAGKTNLGLQFIYRGIKEAGEAGIIVTFEEFSRQMIRDAAALGWDLQSVIDEGKLRIIPTSPGVFQEEMVGSGGMIAEIARETRATRILVDSVSHFQRLADTESERREIFNTVVNMLRRHEFTAFLTQEVRYRSSGGAPTEEVSFEQYASDAALRLSYELVDDTRRMRFIEVAKARGQSFVPGKHVFDIGDGGLTVFPNCEEADMHGHDEPLAPPELKRLATGVPGLDEMLEGGLVRGFTTLVAGPAGVGKTVLGLQFLYGGANEGERGLYVSLRSRPSKLKQIAASLGIHEPGPEAATVDVVCWHPTVVNPYRLLENVLAAVDSSGVRRVVLDSAQEFEQAFHDDSRFAQFVQSMVSRFHAKGVTCLLLGGPPSGQDPSDLASTPIAGIVDAIVGMCYVSAQGEIRRGLYVLKSRGTGHATGIRPYSIAAGGIRISTRRVTVYD
jgi:circadian clock protein KaiC